MNKKRAIGNFIQTSDEWLQVLEKVDEKLLSLKPSEKQWCIAELYDHIMRVARTYQIPNFLDCINSGVKKGYGKNYKGFIIFDISYLPNTKMRLESFPTKIANDFTPIIKDKESLTQEFKDFIEEVKTLSPKVIGADTSKKHYHPLFGWINAVEWFRLIDIHIKHHLPQRSRLLAFINGQHYG